MRRIIYTLMVVCILLSCGGKNNNNNGKKPDNPVTEDSRAKANNKSYVTFSIYQNLGEEYKKLYIYIDAKPEDQKYIWVDKNGNGIKDSGEELTSFGLDYEHENEIEFTTSKELKLYGKITHLGARANFRFTEFSSGTNTDIIYLDLATNFISDIKIPNLSNLQSLSIRNSTVEELDLTKLTKLKVLDLGYSEYFKTDLSKCADIEYLDISSRYYSGFSLSNFTKLHTLLIRDNWLKKFDASKLPSLEALDISGNLLEKDALEDLYKSLPNRNGKSVGILLIKGNPGVFSANYKLAQDKNWEVDDTSERILPELDRGNLPIVKW